MHLKKKQDKKKAIILSISFLRNADKFIIVEIDKHPVNEQKILLKNLIKTKT